MTRFFISYSRVDKAFREDFVKRVRQMHPTDTFWYDGGVYGGDDWWKEILTEINKCHIFIYLISNKSWHSEYCQAEHNESKRLQKRFIPVLIKDGVKIPEEILETQHVDMKNGFDAELITGAINKQKSKIPRKKLPPLSEYPTSKPIAIDRRINLEPETEISLLKWVDIPAGRVKLSETEGEFESRPFKIAKYPVTNAQYDLFIQSDGYETSGYWENLMYEKSKLFSSQFTIQSDNPRVQVTWYEAIAFTRWLSEKSGRNVRLPTEWEWQWAAVGNTGWKYPYGEQWNVAKSNVRGNSIRNSTPVTRYDAVKTHFGVSDMTGNVWEWCLNAYDEPKYLSIEGNHERVIRGGSWESDEILASALFRGSLMPTDSDHTTGFRVIIPT